MCNEQQANKHKRIFKNSEDSSSMQMICKRQKMIKWSEQNK